MPSLTLLSSPADLAALCAAIRAAGVFALDTEFITERHYWPDLGLVQVAVGERLAALDPYAVGDMTPIWDLVADPAVRTVLHALEQEARFCWRATGRLPANVFDVQLAAGLVTDRFPLAYAALVEQVVGARPVQGQTRTDWSRRPLSEAQLRYALEDVRYLLPVAERLESALQERGRLSWLEEETRHLLGAVEESLTTVRWRRLSGIQRLNRRGLAVARAVYLWRDAEAQRRDEPPKRLLRDDLILSLADTRPDTLEALRRLRGLERLSAAEARAVLEAVQHGLAVPREDLPERGGAARGPQPSRMLVLLLEAMLDSTCNEQSLAAALVGGAADLRELVTWCLTGRAPDQVPVLLRGWRATVCGALLEDALAGRITVRVGDPRSDHPLLFRQTAADAPETG